MEERAKSDIYPDVSVLLTTSYVFRCLVHYFIIFKIKTTLIEAVSKTK